MRTLPFILVAAFTAATAAQAHAQGTRLLHEPDISADKVVFVYASDLWTAPASGGVAERLTAHIGNESGPKFSPDGNWVAFTGEYDGNTDVFVMPVGGGAPKRLTYHPGGDVVLGWSPDGSQVLFRSGRDSFSRFNQIYTVPVGGGYPVRLPIPEGSLASFAPDGRRIAYTPIANAFDVWKRYRGGRTTPIWLLDLESYDHTEIPHEVASDTWPQWVGNSVYFLSDRNQVMNLFAYDTDTGEVRQIANHGTNDIKYLSGGPNKLIYEAEGFLHVHDLAAGRSERLAITVPSDLIDIRPRYKAVASEIRTFGISPTGKRAVFEAHGEVLTAPVEEGDVRNLTNTTGAYERTPSWSPDGTSIAYLSDVDGEYALYIEDQMGAAAPRKIVLPDPTFFYDPVWSPDATRIVLTDKSSNLYRVDLASGSVTRIDDLVSGSPVWSPDSRWIAYARSLDNRYRVIWFQNVGTGERVQLTDGMSDATGPAFSRDGKYLFFTASTDGGPAKGGLDLSSQGWETTWSMHVTVLRSDLPSPFGPRSDEEDSRDLSGEAASGGARSGQPERGARASQGSEEPSEPFRIDAEGIDQRILSLPLPEGQYSDLQAAEGGRLFFRSGSDLRFFDMEDRAAEDFLAGVGGYAVSADGKQLLYRSGGGGRGGGAGGGGGGARWAIVPTAGKPQANAGTLTLGELEILIDPVAEWNQMFVEAWRINRDFFYDPGMHGLDWQAVREQYEAWLPDVKHRDDLNYVIGEMLGELSVGHSRVGGGDMSPFQTGNVGGGLLGADFAIEDGFYRIAKILPGQNWDPGLRAPLTEPGVNVEEGEYILRVNGRPLREPTNIHALLEMTANRQVSLLVSPTTREADGRTVTVVPVSSESSLRNMDWVEGNRKKVAEMSGGRVGYVYLPNTSTGGYDSFNRYFFAQQEMDGLVIDERYNSGGKAADYVIDYLDRPLMSYWAPRDGPDYRTPFAANFGPKAMIINEYAGSGGDAMPFYFSLREIGPLVGKRTWGGLVGTGGVPNLMDGGSVTAPGFGIFSIEGEWIIENVGVPPDVEVEMTPRLVNQGQDPQLEKAVELVMEQIRLNPFTHTPRPTYPDKTIRGGGGGSGGGSD
jgi:tricorn protease